MSSARPEPARTSSSICPPGLLRWRTLAPSRGAERGIRLGTPTRPPIEGDMSNLDSSAVRRFHLASIVSATVLLVACAKVEPPADAVLVGGVVHTLDRTERVVEALAIREGRIVAVGTKAEMGPFIGDAT